MSPVVGSSNKKKLLSYVQILHGGKYNKGPNAQPLFSCNNVFRSLTCLSLFMLHSPPNQIPGMALRSDFILLLIAYVLPVQWCRRRTSEGRLGRPTMSPCIYWSTSVGMPSLRSALLVFPVRSFILKGMLRSESKKKVYIWFCIWQDHLWSNIVEQANLLLDYNSQIPDVVRLHLLSSLTVP